MKAHRTTLAFALALLVVLVMSACGGGSGSRGQRLTAKDVPDVLMPGIWHGISGVYRKGGDVSIYTNWTSKTNAQGACMAASGDLGYTGSVTVYGADSTTLASC